MKNTCRLELALKDERGNIIDLVEWEKQIRADAIDEYKEEVLSRFCEYCDQYACNGAMIGSRQECTTICMLRDVCTDIANELKEQKKWK